MFCPNPVAFTVFGYEIYWYGVFMSLSVVLAVVLAYFEAKKKGIDLDTMLDYALLTVPVSIVFARIYYVAFEWKQYASNPITALYIWQGGIAIYGAIIGGVIATLIFSKWKKINFWTIADLVAPGLVLGQAIGRWGNFFNQEAYGQIVTDPSLQFFPYATYIERTATWHQATFFYESMWCLLVFAFLLIYRRTTVNKKDGNVFLWYGLLYGIERSVVEGLRADSLYLFKSGIPIGRLIFFPEGMRVSQVLAFIVAVVFAILLIIRYVKFFKENPHALKERRAARKAAKAAKATKAEEAPAEEEHVPTIDEVDPSLKLMADDAIAEDEEEAKAEEAAVEPAKAAEEAPVEDAPAEEAPAEEKTEK